MSKLSKKTQTHEPYDLSDLHIIDKVIILVIALLIVAFVIRTAWLS